MLSRSLKKAILSSSISKLNVSPCRNAGRKRPSYIESDRTEQNPLEPFLRTALQKKAAEPFSEIKEDSFFNAIIKSFEPNREGPPKRIAWNKDTFTFQNFKRVWRFRNREYKIFQQRYVPERHNQLGNEIAAAHFIVFRGGGVKFYGEKNWVKMKKGDDVDSYDKNLPKKFIPSVYLECIDASDVDLYYEGLENIHKLANLRWLSLRNGKNIDDWCLDKICNEFSNSLQYLDIGNCQGVTHNGLSALCKVKHLSKLIVDNISNSYEFQLSCLMLQDVFPDLEIEGVNYVDSVMKSTNDTDCNYKDNEVLRKSVT